MAQPKLAEPPTATPWAGLVAATVRNPAVLRTALRQSLVRVLAAVHGQPSRPLLVLLIGSATSSAELVSVVQRIASSLRLQPHLSSDAASRGAALGRVVTWRVVHCASEAECAAVLEEVKLSASSADAETMCVLTRASRATEEISWSVSLLDVLLWLWPTQPKRREAKVS